MMHTHNLVETIVSVFPCAFVYYHDVQMFLPSMCSHVYGLLVGTQSTCYTSAHKDVGASVISTVTDFVLHHPCKYA